MLTYIAFDEWDKESMDGVMTALSTYAPELKIALAGGTSIQRLTEAGDNLLERSVQCGRARISAPKASPGRPDKLWTALRHVFPPGDNFLVYPG